MLLRLRSLPGYGRALLCLALVLLVAAAAEHAAIALGWPLTLAQATAITDGTLIVVPLGLAQMTECAPRQALGLCRGVRLRTGWWLPAVLPTVLFLAIFLLEGALGAIQPEGPTPLDLLGPSLWPILLLLVLVAAGEELFFRGYLQHTLSQSLGPKAGLLVTALLFAAAHGLNPNSRPVGLLGLVLAGLWLGLVRQWSGALWPAMLVHYFWNLSEGPIFGFPVSGLRLPSLLHQVPLQHWSWLSGGAFGPEAGLSGGLAALLGIALMYALWRRGARTR